jgi:hypothetical protein
MGTKRMARRTEQEKSLFLGEVYIISRTKLGAKEMVAQRRVGVNEPE